MSNFGDLLIVEIFYLILPAIAIFIALLFLGFFYLKRMKRVFHRYKIQKLEEVENERKRIANDLHDFVASKLIKIKLELYQSLKSTNNLDVHKSISERIEDLDKFHQELRYLVEYIYPKELLSGNMKQSFLNLGKELSNSTTEIIMDIEFEYQLSKEKMHQLYRLMQEKISNIIAHQHPPKIFIGLFENLEDQEVLFTLSYAADINTDNLNIQKILSGRGLTIIKERLNVLKAKANTTFNEGFLNESIIFPIK